LSPPPFPSPSSFVFLNLCLKRNGIMDPCPAVPSHHALFAGASPRRSPHGFRKEERGWIIAAGLDFLVSFVWSGWIAAGAVSTWRTCCGGTRSWALSRRCSQSSAGG
jgi:hypothetical protein